MINLEDLDLENLEKILMKDKKQNVEQQHNIQNGGQYGIQPLQSISQLQQLSQVQQGEKEQEKNQKQDKKDSRSRSRSKKKSDKRRSKSGDRKAKKSKSSKHKKRSSSRSTSRRKSRRSRSKTTSADRQKKQLLKQQEEAQRDDNTILVLNLHLQDTEKDIYKFFRDNNVGKIRDIKIIKDPVTRRSKGIAYVEFYDQTSMITALSLTGKDINGHQVKVCPSQAEKNRVAAQARQMKAAKLPIDPVPEIGPMRIYVGNLNDQIGEVSESDLKDLFSPFGDIEFVDIHRDLLTNKCKGYAFIQYKNADDAKAAISKMNGFTINGRPIKVSTVQINPAVQSTNPQFIQHQQTEILNQLKEQQTSQSYTNEKINLDMEAGNVYLHSAQSKALLMQKLNREPIQNPNLAFNPNQVGGIVPPWESQQQPLDQQNSGLPYQQQVQKPTSVVLLSNMFSQDEATDPSYLMELKEEVEEECRNYGEVEQVLIDQNSNGDVWVKFQNIQNAMKSQNILNNRFFAGKKIYASFVDENLFKKKVRT